MHIHAKRTRNRHWLALLCPLILLTFLAGAGCGRAPTGLTVRVTDTDGNPVPGAMVGLSGNGQTLLTDQSGQVRWTEVAADEASLVVVATGYVLRTTVVPLERGPNETVIQLEQQQTAVPYQPPGP